MKNGVRFGVPYTRELVKKDGEQVVVIMLGRPRNGSGGTVEVTVGSGRTRDGGVWGRNGGIGEVFWKD